MADKRVVPLPKVMNTLVFIKPLSSLEPKDAPIIESKTFPPPMYGFSKIKDKDVDPHAMSDYVLKHDNYITDIHHYSEEDDLAKDGGGDEVDGGLQNDASPKKKSKHQEDPDFDLYCNAKFIVNEDTEDDENGKEETEKTKKGHESDSQESPRESADDPDGAIKTSVANSEGSRVFNNEIFTSGRASTVNLEAEKRTLQSLANLLRLQYEMENVFFQNEYMIKFNVNITFGRDYCYKKFQQLVDKLFETMLAESSRKLIIEVPLDVITSLSKCLVNSNKLSNYYRFRINNISIGSLVNLCKYFVHFSVRGSSKNINVNNWMQVELKMSKKCLIVYFYLDSKKRLHKLVYSYSIIRQMVLEKYRNQQRVYFDLLSAPLLFYADLDDQKQKALLMQNCCDMLLPWTRTTTFEFTSETRRANENAPNVASGRQQPHSTPYFQSAEDCLLGMSKSFCLEVNAQTPMLEKLLGIANICKINCKNFNFYLANVYQTRSSIDYTSIKSQLAARKLPFSVYFAFSVVFSGSYKIMDTLKSENSLASFLDMVARESETNPDSLEQCLYYLKIQCKEMSIVNVFNEFCKLMENQGRLENQKTPMNDDYVLIRRAILSPSHLELMQPIPLLKSRFSTMANLDYALRLTILDDNNRKLNNCKNPNDTEFVKNLIKSQLLGGVQICERVYEFLGSSSSQMRENGVIVYAKDRENRTAQNIRDLAGDLSSFKRNVAKYVARFGLMFSQAMTIIQIPESQVMVYITKDFLGSVKPDFKNYVNFKREQHIFSDGVGIIARSVAETFLPHLSQLRTNDYFPSAFQIRYGGCKGMLVVYDTAKPAIVFRDSMKKYDSPDSSLGILKYSLPRPVFLNRPLINILDQLNVDRDEFYYYFEQSTSSVAKALLFDSCALALVKTYAHSYLPYDRILGSGISLLEEPFLRGIINYLIYYRLNELKSRARIRIPFTNGRMAFGVIDETQTLEYGEIYFQYTQMSKEGILASETAILEGEVMVTKFPCLQPGDVRKLKAVCVESLSHIKDCIVFPSKGARPHPDEMGGSDLDGDEYAVFWDTKLMFPEANFDSMTFPYGMKKEQASDITINDIVEFYCNYLLLNNIGQVANTHLIYSDYHPKGLFSEECHDLAVKYSISLDYQKTGIIEPFPRKYLTTIRPDFMERFGTDRVYLSKRLLGQFYRHCSLIERIVDLSQFDVDSSSYSLSNNKALAQNPKFILPGWKKFYTEAEEIFLEYKLRIVEIMEHLDIANEVVLFSDVYEDKSDVSKVLVRGMFQYFQAKFENHCSKLSSTEDRHLFASAWYAICFEKGFTYNGKILLGLPWIIAEEMCQLLTLTKGDIAPNSAGGDKRPKGGFTMLQSYDSEDSGEEEEPEGKETIELKSQTKLMANNTSVVLYYWNPALIGRQLKMIPFNREQLMDLHQQVIIETQLKVTLGLVVKWVKRIKRDIYLDRDGDEGKVDLIQLMDAGEPRESTEEELLQKFILAKLRQINSDCIQSNEFLPTVSTLFNQFLMYLFELCNRTNWAIFHGKLEEVFLLKYAIFALSFLNKLDAHLDRKFYPLLLTDFKQNQKYYMFMLNDKRTKNKSTGCGASFPLNFSTENVYQSSLDAIFEKYVRNNSNLVHETVRFNLLPMNLKIDLTKAEETLIQKLFFLTGLDNIEFVYNCGDLQQQQHHMAEGSVLMTPPPSPPLEHPSTSFASKPLLHYHPNALHPPMPSNSLASTASPATKYYHSRRPELAPAPLVAAASTPPPMDIPSGESLIDSPFVPKTRFQTRQFHHQSNRPPAAVNNGATSAPGGSAGLPGEDGLGSVSERNQYQVKTSGLVHSIMLLRLLFGHPQSFEQVIGRFNILSASGADEA